MGQLQQDRAVLAVLSEALNEQELVEQKLQQLVSDGYVGFEVVAGVLGRMDHLKDEINSAISEVRYR